jgi:Na+/melibiose symporter-like transporter
VGLAFLLLGWLGFDPARASDLRNAIPLRTLIGIVPAIFSLGVVLCMMRYPETSLREASRKTALA